MKDELTQMDPQNWMSSLSLALNLQGVHGHYLIAWLPSLTYRYLNPWKIFEKCSDMSFLISDIQNRQRSDCIVKTQIKASLISNMNFNAIICREIQPLEFEPKTLKTACSATKDS